MSAVPPSGIPFENAADSTPGNPLIRPFNSLKKLRTFAPSSCFALSASCIVSKFCGLKPGSVSRMRAKLLTSSPAPTKSTSDSATSETTSVLRNHALRPPGPEPRPPSFSVSCRSDLAAAIAGAKPKTMPVTSETSSVKMRTLPSNFITAVVGKISTVAERSRSIPHNAKSNPIMPPRKASSTLSVSN